MNSYVPGIRPSSAFRSSKRRVVLSSQMRTDNFHLSRLSKLTTDAQVRKGIAAQAPAQRRSTMASSASLAQMATQGQKRPGQTQSSVAKKSYLPDRKTNLTTKPAPLKQMNNFNQTMLLPKNLLTSKQRSPKHMWPNLKTSSNSKTPTSTNSRILANFTKSDRVGIEKRVLPQNQAFRSSSKSSAKSRNVPNVDNSRERKHSLSLSQSTMPSVVSATMPTTTANSSDFLEDDKRISDGLNNDSSLKNLLSPPVVTNTMIPKKNSGASLTSSYYKQIEMSKAARERKRQDQLRLQQRINESAILDQRGRVALNRECYKLVESKCMESQNIQKLVSDDYLAETKMLRHSQSRLPKPEPLPEKPIFTEMVQP